MKTICWMASIIFIGLHGMSLMARAQEADERGRRPASSREILAVSSDFERAVNGKAIVRNRCRMQGENAEIEETAEVIRKDGCKLVLRTRKVTRAANNQAVGRPAEAEKESAPDRQPTQGQPQQEIEFTVYADLSELTTPVLLEKQKFGQCETAGAPVLKVSSRSEAGKAIQMSRKSHANGTEGEPAVRQTRRDLSLFFSVPATAEKARKALERAVKSCGGKEWPDEDDLP